MYLNKRIVAKLYQPYLVKVRQLTKQAYAFNEGKPLKYLFFTDSSLNWANIGTYNTKVKQFLDPYVSELAPIMNEKAIVEAYLLRFLNALPPTADRYSSVAALLPKEAGFAKGLSALPPSELLQKFQAMPEYTLIKKRLFLRTLNA